MRGVRYQPRACVVCGAEFEPRTRNGSLCSPACRRVRAGQRSRQWYERYGRPQMERWREATQREYADRRARVAELVNSGLTAEEIASELGVSVSTVYRDRRHIGNTCEVCGTDIPLGWKACGTECAKERKRRNMRDRYHSADAEQRARWQRQLQVSARRRKGVQCWGCFRIFHPDNSGRFCEDCRKAKRGRATCEWDDCDQPIAIYRGHPTRTCGPEHRTAVRRENAALYAMGRSWVGEMVATGRRSA